MLLDARSEFCDATAVNTGAAAPYLIGSQIDTGTPTSKDLGVGNDMWLVVQVDTACASTGSGTMSFSLASDSSAAVHTTTSTVHLTSPVFAAATLVAGYEYACKLPAGTYERYLGILQTTAVAAFESGKVNAFLVKDYKKNTNYPDGL